MTDFDTCLLLYAKNDPDERGYLDVEQVVKIITKYHSPISKKLLKNIVQKADKTNDGIKLRTFYKMCIKNKWVINENVEEVITDDSTDQNANKDICHENGDPITSRAGIKATVSNRVSPLEDDRNRETYRELFDTYDTDGNGYLELKTLERIIIHHNCNKLSKKVVRSILKLADKKNAGNIKFKKFYKICIHNGWVFGRNEEQNIIQSWTQPEHRTFDDRQPTNTLVSAEENVVIVYDSDPCDDNGDPITSRAGIKASVSNRVSPLEDDCNRETYRELFDTYDLDGNGHLELKTLERIIIQHNCNKLSKKVVRSILKLADKKNAGNIKFKKFYKICIHNGWVFGRNKEQTIIESWTQPEDRTLVDHQPTNTLLSAEENVVMVYDSDDDPENAPTENNIRGVPTIKTSAKDEMHRETCRKLFDTYDLDKNGYLDLKIIKKIIRKHHSSKLPKELLTNIVKSVDKKNIGRIKFKKFYNMCISNNWDFKAINETIIESSLNLNEPDNISCNRNGHPRNLSTQNVESCTASKKRSLNDQNGSETKKRQRMDVDPVKYSEEIQFAATVRGGGGSSGYNEFLDFLIDGEKLQLLKRHGIKISNISSILHGSRCATKAGKHLFNLLFDEHGNRRRYLKTLEKHGIPLSNISSILCGGGVKVAEAFQELFDLWFTEDGNKTLYLKALDDNNIRLKTVSSILSKVGIFAAESYYALFNIWFDEKGKPTKYLQTIEKHGMKISNMSGIVSASGLKAPQAFTDLYHLWFDGNGNKTKYIKDFEKSGIHLSYISTILNSTGSNAATAFKQLYDVWFNEKGKKTQYLKSLEKEGVTVSDLAYIMHGAGSSAANSFKNYYNIWFDNFHNKTHYLKTLEENGVNLLTISRILFRAGIKELNIFKDLYDLWFDSNGEKTKFIKKFETVGLDLPTICRMIDGAGSGALKKFKDIWAAKDDKNKLSKLKFVKARRRK